MVWTTVPAFSNSILTLDPTLPEEVQVIVGVVPRTSDSPPFGEVTVIEGVVVVVVDVMAKLLLLVSVMAPLVALVIRIR